MSTFAARYAGVATLALAVLPIAALTSGAHAATHMPAAVRVADLNLSSASDRATFQQRAQAAARKFCSTETTLDLKAGCEAGVRTEINEKAAKEIHLASRI
jgi:UrcA family protein